MSDALKHRIERVEADRREQVEAILSRFGFHLKDPVEQATSQRKWEDMMNSLGEFEKKMVIDYMMPWEEVLEDSKPYVDLFLPRIISYAVESLILPTFVELDEHDESTSLDWKLFSLWWWGNEQETYTHWNEHLLDDPQSAENIEAYTRHQQQWKDLKHAIRLENIAESQRFIEELKSDPECVEDAKLEEADLEAVLVAHPELRSVR